MFTSIIGRNTTIPTKKQQVYSTAADGQTQVEIKIYQGERQLVKDNKLLGQFSLSGIPPAPRGVPQIEVTFDIDADGIVNVSAKDKVTNKDQSSILLLKIVTLAASSGLNEKEIEKMVKESEEFAESDKLKRSQIEQVNSASSIIHETEKAMNEHKDKVSEEDVVDIKSKIESLRTLMGDENSSVESLKESCDVVQNASLKMFQKVYEAKSAENAGGSGENGKDDKSSEKVEDAEFKDSGKK